MAQSRFIQSVLDAARQDAGASGVKSISWFRAKIGEFGKPGPQDLIRDGRRTGDTLQSLEFLIFIRDLTVVANNEGSHFLFMAGIFS